MQKLEPKEAIRAYCTQCLGMKQFNHEAVKNCQGDESMVGPCAFFPYRLGGKRVTVKVFRKFCLACMCDDREAVRECPTHNCECHPYRLGTNPALAGKRRASEKGIEALQKFREMVRDDMKGGQDSIFLP